MVTSNADSGTGTLREAIDKANANGTSEVDYIHFNLPGSSEADRTITITGLPLVVSSYLEIDGTTQPGLSFGVSDAKVKIISIIPGEWPVVFFAEEKTDISFYGLSFDKKIGNPMLGSAIQCLSSTNVTIGSVGKGNVFCSLNLTIGQRIGVPTNDSKFLCENITISANIIGLKEDGETSNRANVSIGAVKNLTIGGQTAIQGNVINGYLGFGEYDGNKFRTGRLLCANNKFGVNFSGSKVMTELHHVKEVNFYVPMVEFLEISNNQFCGQSSLTIGEVGGPFKISGNKFGTDATGTQILGIEEHALRIVYSKTKGIIGGPLATDRNIISGAYSAGPTHNFMSVVINIGSPEVELVNNIFRCNNYPRLYSVLVANTGMSVIKINITSRNQNEIRGTASPGARVDLYYSLSCTFCEPEQLFASVFADSDGNWVLSQPLQNLNIIGAATLNGNTSEFTSMRFDYQPLDVNIEIACDDLKGSIKGIKFVNATKYGWYTEQGDLVSNSIDLIDAPPGKYQFKISDDYCSLTSEIYEIKHIILKTELTNMKIVPASCNGRDGNITGIQSNGLSYSWTDTRNNTTSLALNLIGVEAGAYMLNVTYANCKQTFGPFIIPNRNGLSIDESAKQVSNAVCNDPKGAIRNIKVPGATNNTTYTWKDGSGKIVGTSLDLINISEGIYILEVKDNGGCTPIYSSAISISGVSGISIHKASLSITKATCNTSNGSITGITTTGATGYKWLDAGNAVVASTLSLTAMPPGKYRLVASNSTCEKTSEEFTIEMAQSAINYGTTKILTNATCGLPNGKIEAIFSHNQPQSCFWKNAAGQIIGHSRILENQPPGAYDLYFVDDLGCTKFAQQYSISNTQPANINPGSALVTNDQCGFGKGQITAPVLSGGQRPYFYEWKDKDGRIIGSAPVLSELKAGDYQLTVGDALECGRRTFTYTVLDQNASLPTPVVNDIKICSAGKTVVQVMGADKGSYAIYDDSGKLIETSNTGTFNLDVAQTQTYTVVMQQGNCQSAPATVKVTIENDGIGKLANAFSPNSDGQNDEWLIPGILNYPTATVSIYNRYGVKVFESVGYKTPFNGRSGGADLPIGTYYYIIDLKRGCGLQKGSLTIIR